MPVKTRWARLVAGFALVVAILGLAFALLLPWIHIYGATADELGRSYPGSLLPNPIISWTHGVTIHARPEQVWPWVAQIGAPGVGSTATPLLKMSLPGWQKPTCMPIPTRWWKPGRTPSPGKS